MIAQCDSDVYVYQEEGGNRYGRYYVEDIYRLKQFIKDWLPFAKDMKCTEEHCGSRYDNSRYDSKEREPMEKEEFLKYIEDNSTIDTDGMKLIRNIVDWVWLQSFDKEDTVNTLSMLLDGVGISKSEIEQFIDRQSELTVENGIER